MTRTLATGIAAASIALAVPGLVDAQMEEREMTNPKGPVPSETGYVEANGVSYYYAVYGEGEPLLLLHGGLGAIEMLGPVLVELAAERQVIGVDLHGHGRTALGDRPIDYPDMGDDLAVILDRLGRERVDVMGYSMGGAVALRLAIQHPEVVRRLVVVSAGFARDGVLPDLLPMQASVGAGMAEAMVGTPMHATYMELAPHPEDFPRLLDRMGELMRRPFDWSEEVRRLEMPVMLVYGDSDMLRPEHVVEFYELLGGGLRDPGWNREHMPRNRLAILPDLTHYEVFMAPELASTVLPFLNGVSRPPTWSAPGSGPPNRR